VDGESVPVRAGVADSAPAARPAWLAALAGFDRALLLLALLLTVTVLAYFRTPTDPDVWWHLQNGAVVARTGQVPHGDIYSYTVPGARWIMQQWLLETIMYGLEQTLGYWANVLLFGLVSAGVYALLFRTLRGEGAGRPLAVGLVAAAMVLDAPTWGVRPQVWTTLFFVTFLAVLLRYRRVGPDRRLLILPPLMWLWANFHAGFSIGLVLLGAFVAGEIANRLLRWPAAPLGPLVAVTAACAAVSLLNPNGLDLWLYPLTYLSGPAGNASLRFVQEWQPPDLRSSRGWPFAATFLALIALSLVRRAAGPRDAAAAARPWGEASLMLALAGFTLMALQALRFLPLYGLIWAVAAGKRLLDLWPGLGRPGAGATGPAEAPARAPRPTLARLNLAVYSVVALVLAVVLLADPRAQVHAAPLERDYPAGALAYLARAPASLPTPLHLFHDYAWGGYLLAHGVPVFVDGRADPYNALLDDYVAASSGLGWPAIFARYGVNAALVRPGGNLDAALATAPGWTRRYRDPLAVLYSR